MKSNKPDEYKNLAESIKAGQIDNFYIFHGEERYLLEHSIGQLRQLLCPQGLDGFNYKRYDGKDITIDSLDDAINTYPMFAERTLIEIHDFNIFDDEYKTKLAELLNDLPDYVCIIIVFNSIQFKPDGRKKLDAQVIKNARVVEFSVQSQDKLISWIKRHFKDSGKTISTADSEYLALCTGGLMTALSGEIEKTAAYSKTDTITRADIDAVVIPTLDTAAYKLAEALLRSEYALAMQLLDELLTMREAPHKLLYSISLKMRQLFASRICIESGYGKSELMAICGLRYEFQARTLINTARNTTVSQCRTAVLICAETAYALNSGSDPESCLTELITKLAFPPSTLHSESKKPPLFSTGALKT